MTQNGLRVTLANNILQYKNGDENFMTIKEFHSGYNRMYQLMDRKGTRALSPQLAMNQMADFVDGIVTMAKKIEEENGKPI